MQDKRFEPSGFNSAFQQEHLSFSSYVAQLRDMIASTRTDLNYRNQQLIIDANAPFDWKPRCPSSKKGVLLLHGFTDSPYTMQALGKFFVTHNFWVRAVLLPGHGTVPGDLLDIQLEDWVAAARYGVNSFRDKVDELYVVGFSTGGSLAIHLTQLQLPITGLILIAAALRIKNPFAVLTQWHEQWRWLGRRSQWLLQATDSDDRRYESITMNGIKQVYQLTHWINRENKQKKLQQKILLISTEQDEVISHKACLRFMETQPNLANQQLIYSDKNQQNETITYAASHGRAEWPDGE